MRSLRAGLALAKAQIVGMIPRQSTRDLLGMLTQKE